MEFDSHFTMVYINPSLCIDLFLRFLKGTEGGRGRFCCTWLRFVIAHFETTLDTSQRNVFCPRCDILLILGVYFFDSCWENSHHMGAGDQGPPLFSDITTIHNIRLHIRACKELSFSGVCFNGIMRAIERCCSGTKSSHGTAASCGGNLHTRRFSSVQQSAETSSTDRSESGAKLMFSQVFGQTWQNRPCGVFSRC